MNYFKNWHKQGFSSILLVLAAMAFYSCKDKGTEQDLASPEETSGLHVSGQFLNKHEGKLSITYKKLGGGRMEFDEVEIGQNGEFQFEKDILEPTVVVLGIQEKRDSLNPSANTAFDYDSFYFKQGKVKMIIATTLQEAQVSGNGSMGNDTNTGFKEFSRTENAYIDTLNSLVVKVSEYVKGEENINKERTRVADSIYLMRDKNLYLNILKTKPKTPLALLALSRYASEPVWRPRKKIGPQEIEDLMMRLPDSFLKYPSMVALKEELKVSKITGVGKPVIDFTLKSKYGKDVKISDFKGKYVLLDFWASWCAPCRKENPNIKKQFNKYKDRGFTVISVSLDKEEDRKKWLDAIAKDDIDYWTHLIDSSGFDGAVAKSYFIRQIPTSFLIGPDGKFIGRNLYGENLNKELSGIFGE